MVFWRTYRCGICGGETESCYRCTECGSDLTDTETPLISRDATPNHTPNE